MLGDYKAGDVIDLTFTTRSNGVLTALASGVVSVYKGNSATESTAGVTLTADFDTRTGLNQVHITTVTDGTFYAGPSEFSIVLTAGTVGGVSVVGAVIDTFSIGRASADIASVQADTDNLQTRIPAALVSGRIDASVGAMATDTLTSGALAASAVTEIQTGLSTLDAAGIRTAVGLASANLDTQIDALPTNAELATALAAADDATLAAIAALNNLSQANIRTAVGLASANLDTQLDAIPTNAELATALAAADDATLAAIAALNNLSQANVRTALGMASANLDTQLSAIAGYIDTEVAAIKAKTDNLPAAPAAVGDIPTAAQNAAGLLDLAAGVETGLTPRQAMRLMVAAMAGKLSGAATTTVVIRNAIADNKNRITATVDADGNRSAITVDLT